MSRDRVDSIAQTLHWSEARREHFLDLVLAQYDADLAVRRSSSARVKKRLKDETAILSLDDFHVVSDWYHMVILEMCEMLDFADSAQIAKHLKLTVPTVKQAIRRLLRLKILRDTPSGLKPAGEQTFAGDEHPSDAIRSFHSQILSLAQDALYDVPMELRENQSFAFSMNSDNIPAMHREVREAVLKIISRYAESSARDNIQIFSMQSFPIFKKGTV